MVPSYDYVFCCLVTSTIFSIASPASVSALGRLPPLIYPAEWQGTGPNNPHIFPGWRVAYFPIRFVVPPPANYPSPHHASLQWFPPPGQPAWGRGGWQMEIILPLMSLSANCPNRTAASLPTPRLSDQIASLSSLVRHYTQRHVFIYLHLWPLELAQWRITMNDAVFSCMHVFCPFARQIFAR